MKRIAHLINPFAAAESSDNFFAQPITFATMKTAQEFARGKVEVTLYTAQYAEDRAIVPEGFQMTPDLNRSVYDIGSFQKKRRLPLLTDILDRLYETATEAEYLIYTNVDIGLMPYFYIAVDNLIDSGYDAFVINRRVIKKYKRLDEIPKIYSAIGKEHGGHDCFVFRREVYPRYKLGAVCLGTRRVGRVLMWNLMVHAKNFRRMKFNKHLTFHCGEDAAWYNPELADYDDHNTAEARRILAELEREYGPFPESHPIHQFPIRNKSFAKVAKRKQGMEQMAENGD